MTLIEVMPIHRRAANGALLSALVLATCASNAAAAEPHTSSVKPPRAESRGGGTPSYEVFGKRYHVRASSDGYRERGVASWYGRPFHGRPTSSGEMYDMNEMTAAHTTLPLPTWVEVTNLSNGKRIVVKVNDRGPFVADRVIDLSYAAASALDIVHSGTARVEIHAVAEPPASAPRSSTSASAASTRPQSAKKVSVASEPTTPQPVSPVPPAIPSTPSITPSERLFAEAGKFRTRTDAVEVVDGLRAQGLVNAFVVTEDGRRKSVHRVRVGPLLDEAEVERMSDRLRELGARRPRDVVMN
jgi:peptidoglycan lytic transglycosylase